MEFKRALTRTHVHSKYAASENAVVVCMILFESHVCFLAPRATQYMFQSYRFAKLHVKEANVRAPQSSCNIVWRLWY